MQTSIVWPRWLVLAEIAFIFAVFFIEGAWPVPDVNEPHYLGKTIHYWNPAWAAGDFFLDSKDLHKVFCLTFGWLSLWLRPTVLAWMGRVITWWLLAWSWRRLSFAVLPRPGWSIISAALFAMLMDRFHMAGEWVIGGVESKGFAYVLVFLALEALADNRWNRVWLLLGAASAFHVLVGGWAAMAAALAWLFIGRDRSRLLTMWPALLGGFLIALPGLLPALLLNFHTDAATICQANRIYVFERLSHHLDIFQIDPHFIVRFVLLTVLFFVLSWRISLVTNNSAIKRFKAFVIGAIIIALSGAAINLLVFFNRDLAAGLLRYYWYRLADFAVPLGVAILGCWWFVNFWSYRRVIGGLAAIVMGLAMAGYFCQLAIERLQPANARAERMPNTAAWWQACIWASDVRNTPASARFITPLWSSTFKWHAHRAEVVTWKDVPQDAKDLVEWWARIQDLFAADGKDPEYRWRDSLSELGADRIKQLGKKYKADFLITESSDPRLNLEVVYKNDSYFIYKLGESGQIKGGLFIDPL